MFYPGSSVGNTITLHTKVKVRGLVETVDMFLVSHIMCLGQLHPLFFNIFLIPLKCTTLYVEPYPFVMYRHHL